MHLVCRCSLPVWRRSFLKKGTPRDLFWPHPGSAPGRIWPINNNTCKGPWVLHSYHVSSKSIKRFWRRSRKCEKFTDGRRTTDDDDDGRADDGRCAMTIAHLSLRLRWAKNTNFGEEVEILLRVKCFFFNSVQRLQRRKRTCLSQSEARADILFFRSARKHKLGRVRGDLAACQVSLNSVRWF